jgi:mono/diheme cytochrome c family protein
VSYPFLWGTSWHDVTQWNGKVRNDDWIHRLARNAGQVLGVFGQVDLTRGPPYSSSVQIGNLLELEKKVSKLIAPEWPDVLGAPDSTLVAKGAALYQTKQCVGCHVLVPKNDQYKSAVANRVPATTVGTDLAMTTISAARKADTGVLRGRQLDPLPLIRPTRPIDATELVQDLLSHVVFGVISPVALPGSGQPRELTFDPSVFARNYKARPLNGIWATGPYLHNGSVRTLYQMLLPATAARALQLGLDPNKVRDSKFFVGSREFDPGEVGFKNIPGVIVFELDTTLPGNSNAGHEFGIRMTDDERWALVEYLKTL